MPGPEQLRSTQNPSNFAARELESIQLAAVIWAVAAAGLDGQILKSLASDSECNQRSESMRPLDLSQSHLFC